jgi:hypothetical protein
MSGTRISKKKSNIGAGVAGGGCGLVLAHLASHLPAAYWWRQYAIDLVPALSIAVSGSLLFIRNTAEEYWTNRRNDAFFRAAKRTLEDGLNNELTSAVHKKELIRKLEQLEKLQVAKALDRYTADA